jgi:hypothetical protein
MLPNGECDAQVTNADAGREFSPPTMTAVRRYPAAENLGPAGDRRMPPWKSRANALEVAAFRPSPSERLENAASA